MLQCLEGCCYCASGLVQGKLTNVSNKVWSKADERLWVEIFKQQRSEAVHPHVAMHTMFLVQSSINVGIGHIGDKSLCTYSLLFLLQQHGRMQVSHIFLHVFAFLFLDHKLITYHFNPRISKYLICNALQPLDPF